MYRWHQFPTSFLAVSQFLRDHPALAPTPGTKELIPLAQDLARTLSFVSTPVRKRKQQKSYKIVS